MSTDKRIVSIAKTVQECTFAHESDARLIGNVCAEDVADPCAAALARWARPAAPPAPEEGELARCARIELVTAIQCLASHFESACYDLNGDDLQKATNDIAHARRIAAKHNQNGNGPGCSQSFPAAPPAPGEVVAPLVRDALADLENLELAFEVNFGCNVRTSRIRSALLHYAVLLQQQAAPAPVVVAAVPVPERLPGERDCDAEGRCWCFTYDGRVREWALRIIEPGIYDTHWLPFHAIPLPQAEEEEA